MAVSTQEPKSVTQIKARVFVSYRRADEPDVTERIHDRLAIAFGKDRVFLDIDRNIPIGETFGSVLINNLEAAEVVLVIIGPGWLDIREENNPDQRRLDNPEDWVRREVASSLDKPLLKVIPVLVKGATMPSASELPEEIRGLCNLQAAVVRGNPDFHDDMDVLIAEINNKAAIVREARKQAALPQHLQNLSIAEINHELQHLLDFTEEECHLNRNGQMSARQKKKEFILAPRYIALRTAGSLLAVTFFGLFFMLGIQAVFDQVQNAAVILLVGIADAVILYLGLRSYRKWLKPQLYKWSGILEDVRIDERELTIKIGETEKTYTTWYSAKLRQQMFTILHAVLSNPIEIYSETRYSSRMLSIHLAEPLNPHSEMMAVAPFSHNHQNT